MIAGIFHQGSGLGNQLHRYVATRVLAADKGFEFGMGYAPDGSGKEEGFKGKSFMDIDMGTPFEMDKPAFYNEKKITENGIDVRSYDPEFNFIKDNTVIDGEFQDPRYFEHRMDDIDEWLRVRPVEVPDDVCAIGFRGGEYMAVPDLFLTQDYWVDGIQRMLDINPNMRFEVHTDDAATAQSLFPDFQVIHNVGMNWRTMRNAKYAIIANSSFFIFPRLLQHHNNKDAVTIAPRYWARRNTKVWALPQNYYKQFTYI